MIFDNCPSMTSQPSEILARINAEVEGWVFDHHLEGFSLNEAPIIPDGWYGVLEHSNSDARIPLFPPRDIAKSISLPKPPTDGVVSTKEGKVAIQKGCFRIIMVLLCEGTHTGRVGRCPRHS